jgi:hypothetical protein
MDLGEEVSVFVIGFAVVEDVISISGTLSSCEAEYIAVTHAAKEVLWFWSLAQELGFAQEHPTPIYCDNQGTVSCTHDPQHHSRMKHIDIRFHFIRNCVQKKLINVIHIPGTENVADLLTTPLARVMHEN